MDIGFLVGKRLPDVELPFCSQDSPAHTSLNFGRQKDFCVIFVQPGPTPPGDPIPNGWMQIPGAPGCTREACRANELLDDFIALDIGVVGLCAKPVGILVRFANAKGIRYPLVSDVEFQLATTLGLETFIHRGMRYYKRVTLVVEDGVVIDGETEILTPEENPDFILGLASGHR